MDQEFLDMQRDTMLQANEYMPKLQQGIADAIKDFREGNNDGGINKSSYIEEGLNWIAEVARLTKDVQCEDMNEDMMIEKIVMLVEAYENEDYTLMGDILEYEISPLVEEWYGVVRASSVN